MPFHELRQGPTVGFRQCASLSAPITAGYDLKTLVKSTLVDWGYEVVDLGTDNANDPVDYPDFAAAVGYAVVQGGRRTRRRDVRFGHWRVDRRE